MAPRVQNRSEANTRKPATAAAITQRPINHDIKS